ncbi:hypothetical protein CsSME_00019959 [Camellia sinensis var. sinensis]
MADDIPRGGTPPEHEMDPEAELLSLSVRPFDPATYRLAIHVLPPDGPRQFRDFARGVPPKLLLCEPESHLSHGASEGDSQTIRGYGNVAARDWYMELPDAVRRIVDQAGFGAFCRGLSRLTASRPLLAALVERWWDTTDSFHFSITGDMTMTPYDFSMLTGIRVRGDPIPFDTDMDEWEAAQIYLLGEVALVDVTWILRYDWGGAALATLYGYMSSASHCSGQLLGGYRQAWELWVYAYFPSLAPVPDAETPLVVPFSRRFEVRCMRRPQETFIFFRRSFDIITLVEITWQPWAPLPAVTRDRFAGAEETARFRILLEGPVCRAWYLGERFLRQTLGLPEQRVPGPSPTHMSDTERFTAEEMADYTVSWDAEGFRGEGDYRENVHTYIMRPLSGGRRAERGGPAAPVAGAGAGAGTSRTARVRGRSGARRGRGGGATYQIPFAPPPADHELVSFHDLPSWTFDLLALYSIPPPFQIPTVGGVPTRPSVPAGGDGESRVFPRTKAGRTHVGSSSQDPVLVDDDEESEAEAEAEAESSEEETGDSSDSDSDDSVDDAPGPLSRKRTRTDP